MGERVRIWIKIHVDLGGDHFVGQQNRRLVILIDISPDCKVLFC